MTFSPPKSSRDVVMMLVPLTEQLNAILEHSKYPYPDARCMIFLNIKDFIGTDIMIINIIANFERGNIPFEKHRDILGLIGGDVSGALERIAGYLRLFTLTQTQFQIENLLVILLSRLTPNQSPPRGYVNIVKELMNRISISERSQKDDALNFLQFIRNSMHSNGIHNNKSSIITIDGHAFRFEKGKQIDFAGWHHIALGLKTTIKTLEEIVNSKEIAQIPAPLSHVYIESDKS